MGVNLSRAQLQRLAEARIDDAKLLFAGQRWGGAYYLAGYSVELALKACAARQFVAEAIPDKAFVQRLFTHRLDDLVGSAGLRGELKTRQDGDSTFSANWGIVAEWSPEARYESPDKSAAHYLLTAITDPDHGVLEWTKTFW